MKNSVVPMLVVMISCYRSHAHFPLVYVSVSSALFPIVGSSMLCLLGRPSVDGGGV